MLAFIEEFVGENKYPPTLEEIRTGLNISSKSLVNHHLTALESAAFLSRSPNKSRGIRLAAESETIRVPFLPDEIPSSDVSDMDVETVIALTEDIVPNRNDLFALKVQDDSMIDALVNREDVLILQRQNQVHNGDLVAVRLAGQPAMLLKRYYCKNGHVHLHSANPDMDPIVVDPELIEIHGKVMAVIRQID
jgi:repressor LexA